jgi:hypothetical protein
MPYVGLQDPPHGKISAWWNRNYQLNGYPEAFTVKPNISFFLPAKMGRVN